MKKFSLVILAVSSLILLNSCLDNSGSTTQPQQGAFLLAQTSPTAPTLSIYVNSNTQIFDTLQFGHYTPYIAANPGSYTFMADSFKATGTPRLSSNITIEANKYYSYFIIDSFSKLKAAFVNDVFQKPSSDSVYVRFFNFCPNDSVPLNLVANGTVWSQNRTFNDQSNPQFVAFNERLAGTYTFDLKTVTGTVLKTQSINLTGGKVYTLFAKGTIGNADTTRALSIGQLENYPQQ